MSVPYRHIAAAAGLLFAASASAPAIAGDCCKPPPPPPPPCCGHGPIVRTPDIHVGAPTVIVGGASVSVSASATAIASANARAGASTVIVGGGGSMCCAAGPAPIAVDALSVVSAVTEPGALMSRMVEDVVAVRAVCLDDKGVPHPASQTFAGEAVPANYQGEIYRCIAGASLQATLGSGEGDYADGSTVVCNKNEALALDDGRIVCATQHPERQCHERSLLRKYGPGEKRVRTVREETYRGPDTVHTELASGPIVFDGGVGAVCSGGC